MKCWSEVELEWSGESYAVNNSRATKEKKAAKRLKTYPKYTLHSNRLNILWQKRIFNNTSLPPSFLLVTNKHEHFFLLSARIFDCTRKERKICRKWKSFISKNGMNDKRIRRRFSYSNKSRKNRREEICRKIFIQQSDTKKCWRASVMWSLNPTNIQDFLLLYDKDERRQHIPDRIRSKSS